MAPIVTGDHLSRDWQQLFSAHTHLAAFPLVYCYFDLSSLPFQYH